MNSIGVSQSLLVEADHRQQRSRRKSDPDVKETNGFSKKIENHIAALAVYFMYYNFARIHQTLRVTPAMAAGVTDRLWDVSDIVALLDK